MKICKQCHKQYARKGRMFCSIYCKRVSPLVNNKIRNSLKGRKNPKHSEFMRQQIGKKAIHWKGNKVGYHGIHAWIRKQKGYPKKCEYCGKIGKKSGSIKSRWNIMWSHINHKYTRNPEEYIGLCGKCHHKFHIVNNLSTGGLPKGYKFSSSKC